METKRMNANYDPVIRGVGGGRAAHLFYVKHAITRGI